MELVKKCLIVLRRRWWILVVCLAMAAVGAGAYVATVERTYTASTELFLRAPDVKTSAGAYQGDLFSRQRALTYAKMFKSDELAQLVIDKLGLKLTAQQLADQVSASVVKDTVLMVVSVTDANAQRAANIANGYGDVLNPYVAKIENVENNPDIPPLVQVVTRANPAMATASGYPLSQVLAAALVVGLAVALALIWLAERFDTTVRSRRTIERLSGNTVIGSLPAADSDAEFAQAALRLTVTVESVLHKLDKVSSPPVIAVLSPDSGDDAVVVSTALVRAFEDRGRTAPFISLDGGTMLTEEALDHELDSFRLSADIIVVAAPAFATSIEAQVASAGADAVALVVHPNVTKARVLTEAVDGLRVIGKPILGVVTNGAREIAVADGSYV